MATSGSCVMMREVVNPEGQCAEAMPTLTRPTGIAIVRLIEPDRKSRKHDISLSGGRIVGVWGQSLRFGGRETG